MMLVRQMTVKLRGICHLQFILKTRNKQEHFNMTLNLSMIIFILKNPLGRWLGTGTSSTGQWSQSQPDKSFKEHLDTALRTVSWIPGDPVWSQEVGWMIHVGIFQLRMHYVHLFSFPNISIHNFRFQLGNFLDEIY